MGIGLLSRAGLVLMPSLVVLEVEGTGEVARFGRMKCWSGLVSRSCLVDLVEEVGYEPVGYWFGFCLAVMLWQAAPEEGFDLTEYWLGFGLIVTPRRAGLEEGEGLGPAEWWWPGLKKALVGVEKCQRAEAQSGRPNHFEEEERE